MGHISWQDKQRACLPMPVLRLGAFCILGQIIQKVLALSIQLNVFSCRRNKNECAAISSAFTVSTTRIPQLCKALVKSGSHNHAKHRHPFSPTGSVNQPSVQPGRQQGMRNGTASQRPYFLSLHTHFPFKIKSTSEKV